ncbi:hypothetical protein B7486_09620 [cyanobacterium TDX16]|nr:hypothetical protein B7486_09620 [cyanobacterium TDX16]
MTHSFRLAAVRHFFAAIESTPQIREPSGNPDNQPADAFVYLLGGASELRRIGAKTAMRCI